MKRWTVGFFSAVLLAAAAGWANDYFNASGVPATGAQGSSSAMRSEFSSIATGFDKLPTLSGNGSKAIFVNSGATALEAVTAATARTNLGLAIGTNVQAYSAKLTDIAALMATDSNIIVGNGTTWVAESGATARTSLGLAIGTDVQAYHANLGSLSGITLTAAGLALLDDADAAAQRTTLSAAGSGANTDITSVYLNNAGLKVKDTNASHGLSLVPGSDLAADRTLTVATGDADRTLTLSGNLTVAANTTLNGVPTVMAAQATTSGTSINFTSIPSWWTKITISFRSVSTNGTSNIVIRMGTGGSPETTGYVGTGSSIIDGGASIVSAFTSGFGFVAASAANELSGSITLSRLDTADNTWSATGQLRTSAANVYFFTTGYKELAGVLDMIRITTSGGSDTFDNGKIGVRGS